MSCWEQSRQEAHRTEEGTLWGVGGWGAQEWDGAVLVQVIDFTCEEITGDLLESPNVQIPKHTDWS